MLIRAARRTGAVLLLVFLIFVTAKLLIRSLPGDPVDAILAETGANLDPDVLRKDLGLDLPFVPATFRQLGALLTAFDWGKSIALKLPIGPILLERVRSSFELALLSISLALAFSFLLAMAAHREGKGAARIRLFLHALSTTSIALPSAWFGPILAIFFAVKWRLFALTGGIALPAITLAFSLSGFWLRAFNGILGEALRSDVVRTARAKGLPEWLVLWKHAFLPSAGPLLAYLGSQSGALFAGAVIVETTFDRAGLGSLLIESIFRRDYPVIEAVLIVSSASILFGNLLGDLLQEWSQPKLRHSGGRG